MKVRRYKHENGGIKTYYEDHEEESGYGWDYYYNWRADTKPPKGTESVYLKEFSAWGYSEKEPVAYISCIYSQGMEEKVKKILNAATH